MKRGFRRICPSGPLVLLCFCMLALQPLQAQNGLRVGAETGWTASWTRFEPGSPERGINLSASHGFMVGPQLLFTITSKESEQSAYIITGFRIKRETLRASINSSNGPLTATDRMSVVELPLGFAYRQPFWKRWSVKQEFGATLQVLSAGDNSLQNGSLQPAFALYASPDRAFVPSIYAGAGFEWSSPRGIIFELTAEYHQGVAGSLTMGSVEYRSPDQQIILPFQSDASYLAIQAGVHLPASGFGEIFNSSSRP